MVLPASQRLWVAALVVMVQLPAFLQKCIFDEVQGQTRVVRAAPVHPDGPSMESKDGLKTGQQGKSIDKRAAPLHALSERQRKSRREEFLPTLVSPQPIRIHSWATQESSNLLEAEKERLEAAVQEAVSVVSSVLSGGKQCTHSHTRTFRLTYTTMNWCVLNSEQNVGSAAAQPWHRQILQVSVEEFQHWKLQQVSLQHVWESVCAFTGCYMISGDG